MPRRDSLQAKIESRIAGCRDDVFLTREFADLGGKRQVLRGLGRAVSSGSLIHLGYGVYGRAEPSRLSGQPILAAPQGFAGAARAALTKLGVDWQASRLEQAYNEGRSTQIPVNAAVRVKGRFSRRLAYRGKPLVLER